MYNVLKEGGRNLHGGLSVVWVWVWVWRLWLWWGVSSLALQGLANSRRGVVR
jgi:hypothetical protein